MYLHTFIESNFTSDAKTHIAASGKQLSVISWKCHKINASKFSTRVLNMHCTAFITKENERGAEKEGAEEKEEEKRREMEISGEKENNSLIYL